MPMHYGHGSKKKPAAKKANAKMKAKGVPAAVRKAVTMNMGKKK